MTDTSFRRGDSDLLTIADALDRVRRQAKALLDRGLEWRRGARDPSDSDVGG